MSTGKGEMSFWNWSTEPATYSIHYVEKGEGSQHLIFLHGYGANTFTWKHQLDVFAKQGYHTWAVDLLGFGFSAYLTYRELFSIHAICEWCATSAAILTLMAPLSVWRFLRGTPAQPPPRRMPGEAQMGLTYPQPSSH